VKVRHHKFLKEQSTVRRRVGTHSLVRFGREFGELGLKAAMQDIAPIQWGKRYAVVWCGVEVARNIAMIQQQTAILNVVKGIPPQLYPGYRLNVAPWVERIVGTVFGPQLGRLRLRLGDLGFQFFHLLGLRLFGLCKRQQDYRGRIEGGYDPGKASSGAGKAAPASAPAPS
jgi:hypothetical protein